MNVFVLGATGATGKHIVSQLISMNHNVKVLIRPTSNYPVEWDANEKISVIKDEISKIAKADLKYHMADCDAVASCMGHNLNLKGIYGKPRRLVVGALKKVYGVIQELHVEKPIKIVLMNTSGVRNPKINEQISFTEKVIVGLLRILLPPFIDNEKAAKFLSCEIGITQKNVEWVVVRPDSLIDLDEVSVYEVHPSPLRSALFNPGKTSRINVGNFMASLINDQKLWNKWKGQMPILYNVENHVD